MLFMNFILKTVNKFFQKRNAFISFYNRGEEGKIFGLVKKVRKEADMLLGDPEGYQVYILTQKTSKIPGDIAEVGTYKGGSARLICEAKGDRNLYLFDTFDGLPEISNSDDPGHFHKDQFKASLEGIKDLLKGYPNVSFYKGVFPETAGPIKDKKFSFVNFDVDIYESTVACLEFFYSRMNKGGVILSHDYPKAIGVKKAFDEFFKDKPEIVIETASRQQCMVVKV